MCCFFILNIILIQLNIDILKKLMHGIKIEEKMTTMTYKNVYEKSAIEKLARFFFYVRSNSNLKGRNITILNSSYFFLFIMEKIQAIGQFQFNAVTYNL